eukprot:CAMPEP_0185025914 /NCGR_PEP_ID=MMETSP1103-20130426/9456_1 /TAXON_ID=36769 /ORGANISM="Paraphysomonas bandaiensis, Strain Caron Lab Isolate" /LENGTH=368 /DNA_ID=CAMNT_0027559305 /DNA_START=171 /DNA_END=1277 /DNA_ORIENTATION=-
MAMNGNSMGVISADLEAFIGEPACSDLALGLGKELQALENKEQKKNESKDESKEDSENKDSSSSHLINLKKSNRSVSSSSGDGALGALRSSRTGKAPGRLVQSALQSSLKQSRDRKRSGNNGEEREGGLNEVEGGFVTRDNKRQRHQSGPGGRGDGPGGRYQGGRGHGFSPEDAMMNAQAQAPGFANLEEMNAYFQRNMVNIMQNMMMQMNPPPYHGHGGEWAPPPPPYGAGRGGYQGRGEWRGRGRSPRGGRFGRGRGRGPHTWVDPNTTETSDPAPTAPTGSTDVSEGVIGESNIPPAPSDAVPSENEGVPTGVPPWHRGGRRGGRHGSFVPRGRGRFGRGAIRGRSANKTWVRGPGPDAPLNTDR